MDKIRAISIIFVLALLIRLICVFQIDASPFTFLSIDDTYYDSWALEISGGDIIGDEAFYGLPLYPYLLGLLYFIFGHNILLAKIANAVLGSASCVFLYLLGARVFNKKTGIIASSVLAFYNISIFYENMLSSTALAMLLYLGLLLIAVSLYNKPSLKKWAGMGILAGITSLANAIALLFVPVFAVFMFLKARSDPKKELSRGIAAMAGALLIIIALPAFRNYAVSGDLVPITYHSGLTFYAGNNPLSAGTFRLPPEIERDIPTTKSRSAAAAEEALGRKLEPSEVSSYWFGKGVSFIKENPARAAKNTLKKIYLFWWTKEIYEITSIKFLKEFVPALRLPLFGFALISPLSILGMALAFKRNKNGAASILYLFVGAVALSLAIYFVNSRYRMAADPVLILFAAFLICRIHEKLLKRNYIYPFAVAAGSAALFFLLSFPVLSFTGISAYINLGNSYESSQQLDKAEEAYKKAVALDPSHPLPLYNIGVIYFKQQRYDEAIEAYERSISLNPTFSKPYNNLAAIYDILGNTDKAETAFKRAIEANPLIPELHFNLGKFYISHKRYDEAVSELREALDLRSDYIEAHNNIAYLYFLSGDIKRSVHHLQESLKHDPDQPHVREKLNGLTINAPR
jgi:tetratricopeptide (TPR) repeat protein